MVTGQNLVRLFCVGSLIDDYGPEDAVGDDAAFNCLYVAPAWVFGVMVEAEEWDGLVFPNVGCVFCARGRGNYPSPPGGQFSLSGSRLALGFLTPCV